MEQSRKEAMQVEFPAIAKRVFLLGKMAGGAWDAQEQTGRSDEDVREGVNATEIASRNWSRQSRG